MLNIKITEYSHSWGLYTIGPHRFSVFKAAAVMLISGFCSANSPLIMIHSLVSWCIHQPMNEVWQ